MIDLLRGRRLTRCQAVRHARAWVGQWGARTSLVRAPYDWRTARECEWLWDDLPPSHAKVVRP